jgi:hypothetical protein
MRALEIIWEILFCSFSSLFQILLCEASGWCFGMSRRCSCMSGRLFWLSGRYGLFVWTFILLVRTSVFLRPLPDTTSGCHLSFVRTVNPVELNRFLPALQPICSPLLIRFCCLVTFLYAFYAKVYSTHVIFAVYLHSRYIFVLFDEFTLSFYA